MEPADITSSLCIDFGAENNDKDNKLKVGNHVRMSSYKTIVAKGYTPNWSENVFMIKKVKYTVPQTCVIDDLMQKKLLERLMKKNCKRQIKQILG